MKKISLYLIIIFLLTANITLSGTEVRAEDNQVHITMEESEKPQIGKKLIVGIDNEQGENYRFVWKVNEKEVSTERDYTPTLADCEKWIEVKVYQGNGENPDMDQFVGQDMLYFSKLPVVYIQTDDGKSVSDKENYKAASMKIQGNGEYGRQYTESDRIQIKLRGNLSAKYPQKPYKIKLDKKSNLFGMGKNKHWVLLSNFLDECCMRNVLASKLAKQLGVDAMDMQWVDVVLNGKYTGTYILSEHIRVDENRIDIKDWEEIAEDAAGKIYKANKNSLEAEDESLLETYMKENLGWITTNQVTYKDVTYQVSDFYSKYWDNCSDISNGYLFELSNENDEVSKFKTKSGMPVMLQSPEYLCTNTEMFNYVKNFFANYEEAARSISGYNSKGQSLYEMADLDSMVAYWLVMEIMGNNDATQKSRYAYLDESNKLKFGPVWDFDWGSASRSICEIYDDAYPGWIVSHAPFWKDWVDDPYFLSKARDKYWENREYLEHIVEDDGIIETDYRYIRESGNAFYQYIVKSGWGNWSKLVGRPSRGFEVDYEVFYQFMRNRIKWLDEQFKDLDTLENSLFGASEEETTIAEQETTTVENEETTVKQEMTTVENEETTVKQKKLQKKTAKRSAKKGLRAVVIKNCWKKSGRLQLHLKKVKGAKGYTIYGFSSRRNALKKKPVLVRKNISKTKIHIRLKKKLLEKVKYIRVRAYKVDNGIKLYSKWSKAKAKKTKIVKVKKQKNIRKQKNK